MTKKEESKKSEIKELCIQYLKLFILIVLTIVGMFGLRKWYQNDQEYQLTIPILGDVLSEIRSEELDNYVQENETVLFYIGTASNKDCRTFEKEWKSYIIEHKLKEEIIYLNLSDVKDLNTFYQKLKEDYKLESMSLPMFLYFESGTVKNVLVSKEDKKLTLTEVEKFLHENKIEGE